MKTYLPYAFLISFIFVSINLGFSINSEPVFLQEKEEVELINDQQSIDDMLEKDMPQVEEQIRGKLTLKERLAFWFIQKRIKQGHILD